MTIENFMWLTILTAEMVFITAGVPPEFFFAAYATFVMTAIAGHM